MKSAPSFLIAARHGEIAELEQLALTSALAAAIARLIHALQKERGLSSVFLGSQGTRLARNGSSRRPNADWPSSACASTSMHWIQKPAACAMAHGCSAASLL